MKSDKLTLVKALDWVNLHLKEQPQADRAKVVEAAAVKFGLSPIDEEWLFSQLPPRLSAGPTSA